MEAEQQTRAAEEETEGRPSPTLPAAAAAAAATAAAGRGRSRGRRGGGSAASSRDVSPTARTRGGAAASPTPPQPDAGGAGVSAPRRLLEALVERTGGFRGPELLPLAATLLEVVARGECGGGARRGRQAGGREGEKAEGIVARRPLLRFSSDASLCVMKCVPSPRAPLSCLPADGPGSPFLASARALLGRSVLPQAGRAAALAGNAAWRSADYRAVLRWGGRVGHPEGRGRGPCSNDRGHVALVAAWPHCCPAQLSPLPPAPRRILERWESDRAAAAPPPPAAAPAAAPEPAPAPPPSGRPKRGSKAAAAATTAAAAAAAATAAAAPGPAAPGPAATSSSAQWPAITDELAELVRGRRRCIRGVYGCCNRACCMQNWPSSAPAPIPTRIPRPRT